MRKDTQKPCSENGTAKKKKYSFYFMFPPIGDFDHDSIIKIVELDIPSYPFKQIPSGNHRHLFFKQEKIKSLITCTQWRHPRKVIAIDICFVIYIVCTCLLFFLEQGAPS